MNRIERIRIVVMLLASVACTSSWHEPTLRGAALAGGWLLICGFGMLLVGLIALWRACWRGEANGDAARG